MPGRCFGALCGELSVTASADGWVSPGTRAEGWEVPGSLSWKRIWCLERWCPAAGAGIAGAAPNRVFLRGISMGLWACLPLWCPAACSWFGFVFFLEETQEKLNTCWLELFQLGSLTKHCHQFFIWFRSAPLHLLLVSSLQEAKSRF